MLILKDLKQHEAKVKHIKAFLRGTKEGFVVVFKAHMYINTELQLELKLSSAIDCNSASEIRFEISPVNIY